MITATQAPTIAVRALARLVASTARFQQLVGAQGATAAELEAAALGHVYWDEADDRYIDEERAEIKHPRPRAIIVDDDYGRTKIGTGHWTTGASLMLTLEAHEPQSIDGGDPNEFRDRADWWSECWGAILNQMEVNLETDPSRYLNMTRYQRLGAGEVREIENDPYYEACFQVTWF